MDDKLTTNPADRVTSDGFERIEVGTPLTRLHYFDGKFLRADALTKEQEYYRTLVRMSNLAGGWGVVYGFRIELKGAELEVRGGFATTPMGSTVLLNADVSVPVSTVLARSAPPRDLVSCGGDFTPAAGFTQCIEHAPPTAVDAPGDAYYVITVGPASCLCDNEEVYGKLCEDACVTDTQKRYVLEGVVIRLRPISLVLATSTAVSLGDIHLRNRVASAYFAREPGLTPPTISGAGLRGTVWCDPAQVSMGDEVPIGILVRSGTTAKFVDAWSARRERMDTQARAYWQGRMMMRPWNVFIGQILQFQCQLPSVFHGDGTVLVPLDDDCSRLRAALTDSVKQVDDLRTRYLMSSQLLRGFVLEQHQDAAFQALDASSRDIQQLRMSLGTVQSSVGNYIANRLLLQGGFVDLPPAGYLPVVPGNLLVNEQMRRMFGEGVNLHFCIARPDYIAHAVEEAQHMERISLTQGLDDPAHKEEVQIFVPDGELLSEQDQTGTYWIVKMDPSVVDKFNASIGVKIDNDQPIAADIEAAVTKAPGMVGVARTTRATSGGASLTLVCAVEGLDQLAPHASMRFLGNANVVQPRVLFLYIDMRIDRDPFATAPGDMLNINVELRNLEVAKNAAGTGMIFEGNTASGNGTLTIRQISPSPAGTLAIGVASIRISRQVTSDTPMPALDDLLVDVLLRFERSGNSQAGTVAILPAAQALSEIAIRRVNSVPWVATWGDVPRVAEFTLGRPDTQFIAKPLGVPIEMAPELAPAIPARDRINIGAAQTTLKFLTMAETAPPLAEEIRAAAMDTLKAIQLKTNDATFLDRATNRLFPDAAPTTGNRVRATRDWVMFRRERKTTCDVVLPPAPQPTPPPTPKPKQSYKTWFVELDNEDLAKRFQIALGRPNPAKVPADVRQVDVLQFAAGSMQPDQDQQQILADWSFAQNVDLALAVVWPHGASPDELRLNELRTRSLVVAVEPQFPRAAMFAIESPAAPPDGLGDTAFDGGMLLVGVHRAEVRHVVHRVYFVDFEQREILGRLLEAGTPDTLKEFLARLEKARSLFVTFSAPDQPEPREFQAVQALKANLAQKGQLVLETWPLVAPSPDGAFAAKVCEFVVAKVPFENVVPLHDVAIDQFGNNATGATVAFTGALNKRPTPKAPGKRPAKRPVKRPG